MVITRYKVKKEIDNLILYLLKLSARPEIKLKHSIGDFHLAYILYYLAYIEYKFAEIIKKIENSGFEIDFGTTELRRIKLSLNYCKELKIDESNLY